jgi:hypothetical protein
MKWFIGIAGMALVALALTLSRQKDERKTVPAAKTSFAVLELFTSEGCSSCPAAERLLPTLAADSNVIALSFHVDYWDRLGWKDRFSSAAYTERQQKYAGQFKLESIYTPQLVINGRYEIVGSNEASARKLIAQSLAETPAVQILADDVKTGGENVTVNYRLEGDLAHTQLLAALVQKTVETAVKGGENSGKVLVHTNVVRSFTKQKALSSGQLILSLPKDLDPSKSLLILYTQSDTDLHITGGRAINL